MGTVLAENQSTAALLMTRTLTSPMGEPVCASELWAQFYVFRFMYDVSNHRFFFSFAII